MVSELHRFAVELSRSAVNDQSVRLGDLRTRAGTLLAAASIAGSFSGVTHGAFGTIVGLALLAYLAVLGACIYVLLPHSLSTAFRGGVLLQAQRESGATDDEAYEAVVQWFERVRDDNASKLESLTRWYAVAAVALGAEVLLWIAAIAT